MIESCTIAGPGFVNIILSKHWIAKSIQKMLVHTIETWAPEIPVKRAVVDFSSPNIAKEMHVGNLRSTIIGDTLARMLEFSKVEVLRRNHVGDWGTQFGMLIEYLFEKFPSGEVSGDQAIGDLQTRFSKSITNRPTHTSWLQELLLHAHIRHSTRPQSRDLIVILFKERAQRAVVSLQGGEEKYRKAWAEICEISRRGYESVYQRLGVQLEEKGESFYNQHIPRVMELLNEKGLIEESDGAHVIVIEGKKIPLIVVKKDGGYNYASTDLAALWYRLNEEKAEWIIYVTDVGQREHFEMVFTAAKQAGWLPAEENKYPKAIHVGFGLVLGEDGKRFRTRSTETVKLVDLLDEAKNRCRETLVQRGKSEEWTAEELDKTAEAVGYGAVKSTLLTLKELIEASLNCHSLFSTAHMEIYSAIMSLLFLPSWIFEQGNTAVYLLYAHARICSIIRKSGKDIEELKKIGTVELGHPDERALGLHLLQFPEIVEEACTNLLPNILCEYLYNLSEDSTRFCTNCKVFAQQRRRADCYFVRPQLLS
ncbi:UNVERIFIED_CONTAM: Arginine--tRNA ligase, chloroplastic/mitochondrial [Sesamum angustifolium]|uniref:arginine--tRNA ligase n=1 Tax=Sesamum angustifolium TaxID=2727405 RepID=A0AAW2N987_9LAMI